MKIAVTGAMGTGKSTVVAWLKGCLPGYAFFNVDSLVAELYANQAFLEKLSQRFGLTERKAVAGHVFSHPQDRRWLEQLATEMLSAQVAEILARPHVVVEFPLLFEMAAPFAQFDVVVATYCSKPVQLARIQARDRLSEHRIEQVLAAQLSASLKAGLADMVIDTESPLSTELVTQLEDLAAQVTLRKLSTQLFGSCSVWVALEAMSFARGAPGARWRRELVARLNRLQACTRPFEFPCAVALALWFEGCGESGRDSARQMWRLLREFAPQMLTPELASVASELLCATGGGWLLGDVSTKRDKPLADFEVFASLL